MRHNRSHTHRRGSALLEFGLIMVVLVPLLFGVIDFSRLFYSAIEVRNAAQAGAEYGVFSLARSRNTAGIQSAATADAVNLKGLTVTSSLTCRCAASSTPVACSAQCSPGVAPQVKLNVIASQQFSTLFLYPGVPSSVLVRASAMMRVQ